MGGCQVSWPRYSHIQMQRAGVKIWEQGRKADAHVAVQAAKRNPRTSSKEAKSERTDGCARVTGSER